MARARLGDDLRASTTAAQGWRWGPLVVLLVAGASRWLLASAKPETEPTLGSLTLGCAWATVVSAAWFVRSRPAEGSRGLWPRSALAGALFLGGPVIGLILGVPWIESSALVLALALTPVVVGVASSAMGSESTESLTGRIWPGIAAVAGLLLILAEPSFSDVRTDVVLVLAPLCAGVGAAMFASLQVRASHLGGRTDWQPAIALLGGTLVFALGLAGLRLRGIAIPHLSLTAVAADGVFALLTVLVLARLGAVRWSAQFMLLPLLILLEGLAMVRPVFTTRWVVGLALVATASVYLLLPQSDSDENEGET